MARSHSTIYVQSTQDLTLSQTEHRRKEIETGSHDLGLKTHGLSLTAGPPYSLV